MQKQRNKAIKNIEQLLFYVQNQEYVEVIDRFLKLKATVLNILDDIERQIIDITIDNTPQEMLGLLDEYYPEDCLQWMAKLTAVEQNQVLKEIKQEKKDIQKLKMSFETTLQRSMISMQELLQKTSKAIGDQIEYQQDLTVNRLGKRDEGIVMEANGIVFDANMAAVCVFQPKLEGLLLKGFHQPLFFDGIYYEQPINFKETPHLIRYSLHKGFNLKEAIYEEEFMIFDAETKKANPHCYLIEFKDPILLEINTTYSLCARTSQDEFFSTLQFIEKEKDNALIKFQEKSYDLGDFMKPENIFQVFADFDHGLFPALIVKEE